MPDSEVISEPSFLKCNRKRIDLLRQQSVCCNCIFDLTPCCQRREGIVFNAYSRAKQGGFTLSGQSTAIEDRCGKTGKLACCNPPRIKRIREIVVCGGCAACDGQTWQERKPRLLSPKTSGDNTALCRGNIGSPR